MNTQDISTYLMLISSVGVAAVALLRQSKVRADDRARYIFMGCAWLVVTLAWIGREYFTRMAHPTIAAVVAVALVLGTLLFFRAARRASASQ